MVELRELIRLTLERTGRFVVVGQAGDGQAGIEVAVQTEPDLVLLDIAMPVLDGMEALSVLRSRLPSTTVVMLSGFSEMRLGAEAASRGAAAYIEKGLAPDLLVARLLELLESPPDG